jgi:putative membrane protein
MRRMNALLCTLATSALVNLAACSTDDSTATVDAGADGSSEIDTGTDASLTVDATADTSVPDSAGDSPDAPVLSDAQIVGVVSAANSGEIQEAQLAQSKSANADVVAFATMMVTDHTQSQTNLTALEQQSGISPAASAPQQQLQTTAQQTLTSLTSLSGVAFDIAYAGSQVTAHQTVLALLDVAISQADNASLKTFLQTTRTAVAMHLGMAQALEAKLADAGVADSGSDAGTLDAGDAAHE